MLEIIIIMLLIFLPLIIIEILNIIKDRKVIKMLQTEISEMKEFLNKELGLDVNEWSIWKA